MPGFFFVCGKRGKDSEKPVISSNRWRMRKKTGVRTAKTRLFPRIAEGWGRRPGWGQRDTG